MSEICIRLITAKDSELVLDYYKKIYMRIWPPEEARSTSLYNKEMRSFVQMHKYHIKTCLLQLHISGLLVKLGREPSDEKEVEIINKDDVPLSTHRYYIVTLDDKPIGVAAWYHESGRSYLRYELDGVYVEPEHRHKGIGEKLLDKRLEDIKIHCNDTFREITVETWYNALYKARGFMPKYKHNKLGNRCELIAYFGTLHKRENRHGNAR